VIQARPEPTALVAHVAECALPFVHEYASLYAELNIYV